MADTNAEQDKLRLKVRNYYAESANRSGCCCGPSGDDCCSGGSEAVDSQRYGYTSEELAQLPEGSDMGLGCGNPTAIAKLKPGEVVVDLGSGGGIDCFLAAGRVGGNGRVIGVDMTPEMIAKARDNAVRGGFDNVEFRLGEIEHLPLGDSSVDVIISNCVINLAPDKRPVYAEMFRVLKPGGRITISDIVAVDDVPAEVRNDVMKWSGCAAGALREVEMKTLLEEAGFESISITRDDVSSEAVREWVKTSRDNALFASAIIEARKP